MKRFVVILAGLLMIVGFQNCAKVGVTSEDTIRSDKYGSIVVTANEEDDGSGEDIGSAPNPPAVDVPQSDDEPRSDEDPAVLCEDLLKGNQAQKLVVGLNSIVSERGAMYVSASEISIIDDYRGKLLVMGAADGSRLKIDRIQANRGRLILCNADVAELSDSRGRIDLINSTIAACEEKLGNIKMDSQSSVPSECSHNTKVVAL